MPNSTFHKIALAGEAEAEKTMLEVEVLAHIIADKMEHLHGDRWSVHLDHRLGFLVIKSKH